MDLKLSGLNVLVTGGTAGIGAAIVECFAREGANVAFCSRSQSKVDAMCQRMSVYNVTIRGASVDINDAEALADWVKSVGELDIVVHNVSGLSTHDWQVMIDTDIKATASLIEAALPALKRSECGALTYIGSKVSTYGTPDFPVYAAGKACITHYMKSLSLELGQDGIRVNVIAPGDIYFKDGAWDNIRKNMPDLYQKTVDSSLFGRLGTAEEIADSVVFISSPVSSFTTGAHLLVDGGTSVHVQG
ncbi:MAG: SDR family oxidoreductase [Porticoccaceae bacterium]|nr:SDR family oxidoreductase [Pseudomonadales bacterium]MCP5171113.1 SDR family oxidoreductase [Pseudomonadales bacterium]MCP5301650.1 SDR family oxidoreductase [Pseudomonadales bacterium]